MVHSRMPFVPVLRDISQSGRNPGSRDIARLSWLCGEVFPGQADDVDFFGVASQDEMP